jgi:hypothetical protein
LLDQLVLGWAPSAIVSRKNVRRSQGFVSEPVAHTNLA